MGGLAEDKTLRELLSLVRPSLHQTHAAGCITTPDNSTVATTDYNRESAFLGAIGRA
jgi:hypothetical protein